MADMLTNGVSGLLAFQQALSTTSNNIANASTPGYNREQVVLNTQPTTNTGVGWIGNGVSVSSVRRIYDAVLGSQVNSATSGYQQLSTFSTLANSVTSLLTDATTGLSPTLQQFASAVQTLSNSPADVSARQVVLSQAGSLVNSLKGFQSAIEAQKTQVNTNLGIEASAVSSLAQNIADLNNKIVSAQNQSSQPPNDLLDQRNQLIQQLSQHLSVSTTTEQSGAIDVFVGSGQALVINTSASKLVVLPGQYDPSNIALAIQGGSASVDVTSAISGGAIGGLMQFRSTVLDPAQRQLGQIATGVAALANAQQAQGLDMQGNFGTSLFTVGGVGVLPSNRNSANQASVSATVSSVPALTGADYVLAYNGTTWSMTRTDTGASVALSGAGSPASPLVGDGVSMVVSGTAQSGDQYLIQPVSNAVAGMAVAITDPNKVAAALPLVTAPAVANTGGAAIDAGSVPNPGAWTRGSYTLIFDTTSSWQAKDATGTVVGSGTYSSGSPILFNGMQVTVTGTPAQNDAFSVTANTNGTGDNRNALKLAAILDQKALIGGTTSVNGLVDSFATSLGISTNQAQISAAAQKTVLSDATQALSNADGVNLDQEAATLIQYQQAYQAAAQTIAISNTLFNSLLTAIRS